MPRVILVSSHAPMVRALEAMGCQVAAVDPRPGRMEDAAALYQAHGPADLLLQREQLSGPILLKNLESVPCLKAFWSLDTHLNLWWHAPYSRLFDLVLTTQAHLAEPLARATQARVRWLPWFGERRRFVPHALRLRQAGFVGRITPHRPARTRFVELLADRCGCHRAENLFGPDMLAWYDQTRVAPNESIFGEVNFRLFETASCGCLPVVQAVDHPLDPLFVPGREAEVYHDALELLAVMDRLAADPRRTERMALAAWERLNREHLPGRRMEELAGHCRDAPRAALAGPRARTALSLAALELWMAGRLPFPPAALARDLARDLDARVPDPEALAGLLRLLCFAGQDRDAAAVLDAALAHPLVPEHPDLALAAGMAALKLSRGADSAALLARVRTARPDPGPDGPSCDPGDLTGLLAAWAAVLPAARTGAQPGPDLALRPGFPHDPRRHLPASALDCLSTALALAPDEAGIMRGLAGLLDGRRGAEHTRLAVLSALSLRDPGDWRTGLHLGLTGLAVFRPREALEDLAQAARLARNQGQAREFARTLARFDPGGRLKKALQAQPGQDKNSPDQPA